MVKLLIGNNIMMKVGVSLIHVQAAHCRCAHHREIFIINKFSLVLYSYKLDVATRIINLLTHARKVLCGRRKLREN